MDRLSALIALAALFAAGCDEAAAGPRPPGRVIAMQAQTEAPDLDAFCESRPERRVPLPPLAGEAPPAAAGWRWVNVWATWCRPCVEELPMIADWRERLEAGGAAVELVLLSADREAEAVERFVAEHPEAAGSRRVDDPQALPEWLGRVGLDEGAPLPIHLFFDPRGRATCARTGALHAGDYAPIAALLRAEAPAR